MTSPRAARLALSGMPLALLIASSHAVNDAFTNILPVYLPTLQIRFGLGEAVLATLVAVISLSANVLQAFVGGLSDRLGRRRMSALGLITGSTLMSFLGVVSSFWALVLLLAIGGLGSAIFHPGAVAMIRQAGRRTSLYVGMFAAAGALGSAVMPVVVLALMRSYGPQYLPYLAVVGVATGVALLLFAPPQAPVTRAQGGRLFDLRLFLGPVGLLSLAGIMRSTAFVSFSNAMPLFLVNVRGFAPDASVIGSTLAVYGAASSVAGLLSGVLEARIGRLRLIVGSLLLALPAMASTLFIEAGSLPYYLAVGVAAALTNAAVPLMVVSAQELAPHAVATASGMLMGLTWGTAGVAYVGFGALQELIGLQASLLLSFLFLWPAAALAYAVLRRHRAALG